MHALLRTLPLVLAMGLLWRGPALACDPNATAYYLDPTSGNDANDCSESSPCRSAAKLQTLLNTLTPGQQVLLKKGTTLVVTSTLRLDKRSGTAEQPLTLGSYGTGDTKPVLESTTMAGGMMQLVCTKQAYWTITGLHFKARKGAVDFASCAHSGLYDSDISQCDQECLHIGRADPATWSHHITVKDVAITAPARTEGAYIGTDPSKAGDVPDITQDILIDRVTISGGPSHECIELKAGTQRVTIQNSLFEHNVISQNGCLFSSTGTDPAVPQGNYVIKNNTIRHITGPDGFGIRIRNSATIEGNEVSETSQLGIFLESLSGYPVYRRTLSVKSATK